MTETQYANMMEELRRIRHLLTDIARSLRASD